MIWYFNLITGIRKIIVGSGQRQFVGSLYNSFIQGRNSLSEYPCGWQSIYTNTALGPIVKSIRESSPLICWKQFRTNCYARLLWTLFVLRSIGYFVWRCLLGLILVNFMRVRTWRFGKCRQIVAYGVVILYDLNVGVLV